jgi:hypothetical protein
MTAHGQHHHRRKDSASIVKERSLRAIALRKKAEKILKVGMIILAIIMGTLVVLSYVIGK